MTLVEVIGLLRLKLCCINLALDRYGCLKMLDKDSLFLSTFKNRLEDCMKQN